MSHDPDAPAPEPKPAKKIPQFYFIDTDGSGGFVIYSRRGQKVYGVKGDEAGEVVRARCAEMNALEKEQRVNTDSVAAQFYQSGRTLELERCEMLEDVWIDEPIPHGFSYDFKWRIKKRMTKQKWDLIWWPHHNRHIMHRQGSDEHKAILNDGTSRVIKTIEIEVEETKF